MHIKDLIESLPKTTDKDKGDVLPADLDIHARLVAALHGQRLIGAKPLAEVVKLDETRRVTRPWEPIEVPEGTHEKLAEAFTGPIGPEKTLPADIHERAAAALTR